ncbi:interferon gamma receptor 1 [Echinops telfairi]|uniref:Interferon gamma receptor 1 n=1 Tax=Echinops telfairi TaxID=9371 RepID=A0ABM1VL51_ECHTE|nr:interferon gamma receptor 1 [Echinops telfairi]
MAPFLLLFVLVVQAPRGIETGTAEPEPSSVPLPTNVAIESYNMNPVLHWEYPAMVPAPVFTVEVKNYGYGLWKAVCTNISLHHCNIFNEIYDPLESVWARVKARLGQKESAYVETKDFIICKDGKVGPPKLHIREKEDIIIIDIFHPLVIVNGTELGTVFASEDTCYSFTYNVNVKTNGSKAVCITVNECNETQCWSSIPKAQPNTEYCASAEGHDKRWSVSTEKSEEYCIVTASNSSRDSVWIPVVFATVFFVVLILISVFIYCYIKKKPFKRRNNALPKSLLTVVKHATLETKPEAKYISLITSYQPVTSDSESVVGKEPLPPAALPSVHTEDSPATVEHTEVSSEIVVVTEEGLPDVVPGSPLPPVRAANSSSSSSSQSEPCSITVNSYHSRNGSDSGLMGSGSFLLDSEAPPDNTAEGKLAGQAPTMLRNTTTSFGYDKPHVLVELPVDDGGKETLIGYRLAADANGFS